MIPAPKVTADHQRKRLQFARYHAAQVTHWTKIFSFLPRAYNDFRLSVATRKSGVCIDLTDIRRTGMTWGKEPEVFQEGLRGGSVMVRAAFCADGTIGLEFVTSHMNSINYQTVLNTKFLPYVGTTGRRGYVFQQESARIL